MSIFPRSGLQMQHYVSPPRRLAAAAPPPQPCSANPPAGSVFSTQPPPIELARTVVDHVTRVLPNVTMDGEERRRLQTDVSELDRRLRAMEAGASD